VRLRLIEHNEHITKETYYDIAVAYHQHLSDCDNDCDLCIMYASLLIDRNSFNTRIKK
jgi:hypothetical protein